ncbi:hypothetical protein E4T43_00348 [Aureobasidium subglaciale]|nr:hypothetical protein E4T43_00348 [Aureobasidium subglaciale]
MESSTRKHAVFIRPEDIEVIDVEDDPDRDTLAADYEFKDPIKQESQETELTEPGAQPAEDISDFLDGASAPYADGPVEPGVQRGAKREPSTMPETSTLKTPITTAGLGTSMLQARKTIAPQKRQTEEETEALRILQEGFFTQMAALHVDQANQDEEIEPEVEVQNPFVIEAQFIEARDAHSKKSKSGQLTQDEERAFMKLASRYSFHKKFLAKELQKQEALDKKNAELTQKDSLFVAQGDKPKASKKRKRPSKSVGHEDTDPRSKKRTKTAKASKKRKDGEINLDRSNIVKDAETAANLPEEPTFQAGNVRKDALDALKKDAPKGSAAAKDTIRLNKAIKSFTGRQTVKPAANGQWAVSGMQTTLKSWQTINAGFMRRRETGVEKPRGGILADQMGLGKTVTCLTNIVNGRPREGASKRYTTLVVVPPGIIAQWEEEIKTHCVKEKKRTDWGIGRVEVFRNSMSKGYDLERFDDADIVLTSYNDVEKSWPNVIYPHELAEEDRDDYFAEHYQHKLGPLHQFRWLRLVLDEGHNIRNPETKTAQACFRLIGIHRWILTGTPMFNGAHDLYAQFAFVGHPIIRTMGFDSFKSTFCNEKDLMSWDALTDDLLRSMARFTHADSLFGSRLITLPALHESIIMLNFTPLEREIYDVVENRCHQRIQIIDENGEPSSTRMHILALISLQRQMTAHPLMLQSQISDILEPEDLNKIERAVEKEMARVGDGTGQLEFVKSVIKHSTNKARTHLKDSLDMSILDEGEDFLEELSQLPNDHDNGEKNDRDGPHGKDVNYSAYMTGLKSSKNPHVLEQRLQCSKCKRLAVLPKVAPCGHYYCTSHLDDLFHATAAKGRDRVKCIKKLDNGKKCGRTLNYNDSVDPTDAPKWSSKNEILPSTKTLAFKAQILAWLDAHTGDPFAKIIVFTQWVTFLRILSCICEGEKWKYKELHGKLSQKQKNENIEDFKFNPETRILLATMKTGGVGLNLTCARYILLCDPYWNDAGEQQAFGRVFRIGQTKETEVTTLIIRKTIDKKLQRIKERKTVEITQVNKNYTTGKKKLIELLTASDSDDEDAAPE